MKTGDPDELPGEEPTRQSRHRRGASHNEHRAAAEKRHFDPEANKRDFAEYLRYGIGRTAQDAESEVERLKRMDNQLERIIYDHERESERLAQLDSYIAAKKEELERLKDWDDCTDKDRDLEQLSFEIAKLEEKATKAQAEISRLFDLKAKRVEGINKVAEERTHFGRTIRNYEQGLARDDRGCD